MNKKGYTVKEFVEIFPMALQTVYKKIKNGDIPVYNFGQPYIIPKGYVDKLLAFNDNIIKEETPVDLLLVRKLEELNLNKSQVVIQETEDSFVVFSEGMGKFLFNVDKC